VRRTDEPTDAPDLRGAVRRLRAEVLLQALLQEGKTAGVPILEPKDIETAGARRRRAQRELALTPEGRACMQGILERASSTVVRATLRGLAEASREGVAAGPRPLLATLYDAADIAEQTVEEFGFRSSTAHDWCVAYGLLMGRFAQANARASAMRHDPRSISVRETKDGKTTTVSADSASNAADARALTTSRGAEYALRMAKEVDAWFDEAERARHQAAQSRAWADKNARAAEEARKARTALPAPASANAVEVAAEPVVQAAVPSQRAPEPPQQEPEEKAFDPQAVLLDQGFCSVRGRMVPTGMVDRPRPSAADGPGWVAQMQAEEAELHEFDARMKHARMVQSSIEWRRKQGR
jgi:hypothetical protein